MTVFPYAVRNILQVPLFYKGFQFDYSTVSYIIKLYHK